MQIRIASLLLLLLFTIKASTQKTKEVYESFEAGCRVFNYHFKQAPNGINSVTIYEIGKPLELLDIDAEKLTKTTNYFKTQLEAVQAKIGNAQEDEKEIWRSLEKALLSINDLAPQAKSFADSVMKFGDKRSEVEALLKSDAELKYDSLLLVVTKTETKELYSMRTLISQLYNMVQTIGGQNGSKYASFYGMKDEVFEAIFLSFMEPLQPTFRPECPVKLSRLALQVFGSIRAQLGFLDDAPVTGYLKLKKKNIRVYIESSKRDAQRQRRLEVALKEADSLKVKAYNDQLATKKKNDANAFLDNEIKRLNGEDTNKVGSDSLKSGLNYLFNDGYVNQRRLKKGFDYLDFEVKKVQVEFEDGNIKNLIIETRFCSDEASPCETIFRNNMPIPVSNKFDPEAFENHKIFAGKSCEVYRQLRGRGIVLSGSGQKVDDINNNTNCENLFILLSDLMDYVIVPEVDKEDYSPANAVYNLTEQNAVQELRKEKRSQILVLKAFTDFVGVDDDHPNGLIQFEASKRINLLTKRYQWGNKSYHGVFTFIEPRILFSKLEQNNKYLFLPRTSLDTVVAKGQNLKRFNVNPLQLYQFSNFSIQTDLNLYKVNWAQAKSNFQLNAKFGYYRTAVSDSVNVLDSSDITSPDLKTDNINSRLFGLNLVWEFKPDGRFGISLGWGIQHIKPFSDNYSIADGFDRFIHTVFFDGYLNTNDEGGRLFFRTRFNQLFDKPNRNFMQIQLGYAANIFKSK